MTSLFELGDPGRGHAIPVELLASGRRGVSPLEFFTLDEEMKQRDQARPVAEDAAGDRARQTRAMIDAARDESAAETRRVCGEELEQRLGQERMQVERVCAAFALDRQRYFAAAETQVVRLALAMAKRVLAREVQADAMHLQAIVRAALGRVRDGSATVLRVPRRDVTAWSELFADAAVEVVGDEALHAGDCVLETEVGRVELGVQVQMDEIERGFGAMLSRQGE